MQEQRRFMGKDDFLRPLADGKQLILHVIGKDILPVGNPMNLLRLTQLGKHGLGNTMGDSNLCFNHASMRFCNGAQFSHVIHLTTPQYQIKNIIRNIVLKDNKNATLKTMSEAILFLKSTILLIK